MPEPRRKPCGIQDICTIPRKFRERRRFVNGHASRSKAGECGHDHATVMRAMVFAPSSLVRLEQIGIERPPVQAVTPWQPAGTVQVARAGDFAMILTGRDTACGSSRY